MESEKSLKEDWLLWLLVGTALVLLLGYWLVVPPADQKSDSPSWLFTDVPEESVKKIRRYENDQLQLELVRSGDGSGWTISKPSDIDIDQRAVNEWIKTLIAPRVSRRFQARPGSDYGFAQSDTRLQVVVNNTPHDLFLGGQSPTQSGSYLRYGTSERAPVFLVPESARRSLDLTLYDVRDKRLFEKNAERLNQITLRTGQKNVRYRKVKGEWSLVKPSNQTLNDTQSQNVENSLGSLLNLTADRFYDGKHLNEFEPPLGSVILQFRDEKRTLVLGGKRGGNRLVRVKDNPVVAASRDPLEILKDLPHKPDGWPTVQSIDERNPDQSLPERIRSMKPGGTPR